MPASLLLMKGIGINAGNYVNTSHDFSFTTLDSANIAANVAPLGRPAAGVNLSYESWLVLQIETAPENAVTNFRFWSSGNDPATGIEMYVGTAYASATPSINQSIKATHDAKDYTGPDNSLIWWNNNLTTVGDKTRYLVMQLRVGPAAPLGTLYGENCVYHYSYDES